MKLEDNIPRYQIYKDRFNSWEATMKVIDEKRSFFELRKPTSLVEKVCVFIDGSIMCVYGDYGSFTFDRMTWEPTPWNLQYDNTDYQMEKLNQEHFQLLHIFDDSLCQKQFLEWMGNKLHSAGASDPFVDAATEFMKKDVFFRSEYDVEEFIHDFKENDNEDDPYEYFKDPESLTDFLKACYQAMGNMSDATEWISFVRNLSGDDINEEMCDSPLWDMGKIVSPRYFINMYAIKVISQKISKQSYDEELLRIKS